MPLFSPGDRRFAEAISALAYCNPFLPERIDNERAALGDEFHEGAAKWNIEADYTADNPNLARLCRRCEDALESASQRVGRTAVGDAEAALHEGLALFVLYHRYREGFDRTIAEGRLGKPTRKRTGLYETFTADARRYLPGLDDAELSHLFAWSFQIRRAFHNIFFYILGRSRPAARLRAGVWQSIFTCDMVRYRRVLYTRMADYTSLITGPSGTGKELVAQAIGLSRYIPFDPRAQTFTDDFAGSFHPLNLAAMSPTLIESELFGHARGSFTGAVADRQGWLEICRPMGTVFLDEIGELDPAIQVKLLRVLQTRQFSRLGDTRARRFEGKIIAATNRDLTDLMRTGRFRDDLYYRLCSDMIATPSLRDRIADDPAELRVLITHLATRIVGEEAADVAREVERWIEQHLGRDYAWPGNVRELEQCVRNVLIRRSYHPAHLAGPPAALGPRATLAAEVAANALTADQLLGRYCTLTYHRLGSYEQAAQHLGLDRRTVKSKIDRQLLEQLQASTG